MKVVFIITRSDEIGGAQIHVRDITTQMVKDGHDVTVLVGGDGPLVEQLEENRVKVIKVKKLIREISPVNDFKAYLQIKKELKLINPDLVTTHSSKAGLLGRLAAKACGYPVIFTAHGWAFTDGVSPIKKIIYKNIEKLGARFSDKIINVSEKDRQLAIANHIGNPNLHVTVHNGIGEIKNGNKKDIKNFNFSFDKQQKQKEDGVELDIKVIKKEFGLRTKKDEVINIVMVARFSAQKDHETLFHALSQLKDYNWYLRLVGIGPKLDEMKTLAETLGLESSIEFMGERFDVPEILDRSDVYVLTTNWEGLPISIIEAMRAGLPIIASNVGGVSEQLNRDLRWGLVDQRNIKQVKERLESLFNNPDKAKKLGEISYKEYVARFSFKQMYVYNSQIYNNVISVNKKTTL